MGPSLAPIAFFAYKRADLAGKTLSSLKNCRLADKSFLRIYCDGPKGPKDAVFIEEARRIVRSEKWCAKVEVIERNENWGLSRSIRAGVSELCEEFGRVIVIEDDLLLHPSFLEFMNRGLLLYENEPRVMEISAYNYPVDVENKDDAFFICHASCWGWGTWKRAWDTFDDSSSFYERMKSDRALRTKFDMGGAYPYFELLRKQLAREVDSWGIFWYQTLFKNNGLVLIPNKTLVCNRGTDELGTHVGKDGYLDIMSDAEVRKFPVVSENAQAFNQIARYLKSHLHRSILSRLPFSWIRGLTAAHHFRG